MSFEAHVLSNGPWSISKLGVIEKCSQQYFYKYQEKLAEVTPPQPESLVGTAVHTALELALTGTPVARALFVAGKKHGLTSNELEDLDARSEQVADFVQRVGSFKAKYGVRETLVERKWGMTSDFRGTGFFAKDVFFRGVVDLAMIPANNDLVIIDHKSGKERPLDYYTPQLRVYALMGLAMYPETNNVKFGINFVTANKMVWGEVTPAKTVQTEYRDWLAAHMNTVCQDLLTPPSPRTSKLCDWCGYKPICPAFVEVSRDTSEQQ
jgi:putative RecB family exonuclease